MVESIEGNFCHQAAVTVRHKDSWQPGLRPELECKQPRCETREFEKGIASTSEDSAETPSLGIYPEGKTIRNKKVFVIFFAVEFLFIFSEA